MHVIFVNEFFFLLFSIHIVEDEVQTNAIIPYQTGHSPLRSYRLCQHATALQSHTWYNHQSNFQRLHL